MTETTKIRVYHVSSQYGAVDLTSVNDPANAVYNNELGLSLTDPENLLVTARTWRRKMQTSPFFHGGLQVNAVMDMEHVAMTILVVAPTIEWVTALVTAVTNCFSVPAYFLQVQLDGVPTYTWLCYEADIAVNLNRKSLKAHKPEIKLTVPRYPIPAAPSPI